MAIKQTEPFGQLHRQIGETNPNIHFEALQDCNHGRTDDKAKDALLNLHVFSTN